MFASTTVVPDHPAASYAAEILTMSLQQIHIFTESLDCGMHYLSLTYPFPSLLSNINLLFFYGIILQILLTLKVIVLCIFYVLVGTVVSFSTHVTLIFCSCTVRK